MCSERYGKDSMQCDVLNGDKGVRVEVEGKAKTNMAITTREPSPWRGLGRQQRSGSCIFGSWRCPCVPPHSARPLSRNMTERASTHQRETAQYKFSPAHLHAKGIFPRSRSPRALVGHVSVSGVPDGMPAQPLTLATG